MGWGEGSSQEAAMRSLPGSRPAFRRLRTAVAASLATAGVCAAACLALTRARTVGMSADGASYGTGSPVGLERVSTLYDWCDCRKGLSNLTVWPGDDTSQAVTVDVQAIKWIQFEQPTKRVSWICDGMRKIQTSRLPETTTALSAQLFVEQKKGPMDEGILCGKDSGRIRWNQWRHTERTTSVPFTSDTDGYACVKIPVLVRTHRSSLLAFAEARVGNCSDFAATEIVLKRSHDDGRTWSELERVAQAEPNATTWCDGPLVIGNVAPVQLSEQDPHHPGRILLPHMRNNFAVWMVHSDDDGVTWSTPRELKGMAITDPSGPDCKRNMTYFGYDIDTLNIRHLGDFIRFIEKLGWGKTNPYDDPAWRAKLTGPWQFIGIGPAGSLQLSSGRVLVPGYHSYIRGLAGGNGEPGQLPISQIYNNFALGHVLISDDGGDTWRLSSSNGFGDGKGQGANEDQFVQLRNGSVLVNSRSMSTGSPQLRLQARSDDQGDTFTATSFVPELPEPFNGCHGSLVTDEGGNVYFSHPDPSDQSTLLPKVTALLHAKGLNFTGRDNLTLWTSRDDGTTYPDKVVIDEGFAGYSSLQSYTTELGPVLGIFWEQADPVPVGNWESLAGRYITGGSVVMTPTRLVFREYPLHTAALTV